VDMYPELQPPWPDPVLDGPEQSTQDPLGAEPFSDPLGGLANALPVTGLPAGNPDATANYPPDIPDLAEAPAESLPSSQELPEHLKDPLHDLLDELERQTEEQVIKPEEPEDEPAVNKDTGQQKCVDSFSKLPAPDIQGSRSVGGYPFHPRGHCSGGTGIRHTEGEMEWCALRKELVWPDDCAGCSDAEMVDTGDGNEQQCRYTLADLW